MLRDYVKEKHALTDFGANTFGSSFKCNEKCKTVSNKYNNNKFINIYDFCRQI